MRPIFQMPDKDHVLSAPPFIQLEMSTGCTQKCKHCYNFWRTGPFKPENLSREKLDFLINEFVKNKVMHVVLSGGEPFLNFENVIYAIEKLTEKGISVSVNSNLTLATPEKVKRLKKAGLPHILTSLDASNEESNDFITSTSGSFKKIIQGIKNTLAEGIRVSINMVVSQHNIDQIYETAKLASELGCHNFNITRTIPIPSKDSPHRKDFVIEKEDMQKMIDAGLKIEKEFNFDKVSTMIPFPYCALGDLKKYEIFLEKCSCVAGTKLMSINVNGDAHACVHEAKTCGNVYKDGLKGAWQKLLDWQDHTVFPEGCKKCDFFDECIAGCRMAARAYDKIDGYDNLRAGPQNIVNPIKLKPTQEIYESVEKDTFIVMPTIRFREENNFYLVTTFGAKSVIAENKVMELLKPYKESGKEFRLKDMGGENKEILAYSLFYGLIEKAGDKEAQKKREHVREFVDKKIKLTNKDSLKKEAEAFDIQTDERIKAGFIPDLRRLRKVDWFYNNMWRDPEFVKIYLMPKVNFVIDIAKKTGGKVLELGCGYGYLTLELARNGLDVTGVDLSPKSIEIAKKFAEENLYKETFGSLKYECQDIMSMDLGEETFDTIVFFSTLHHMPDVTELFPKLKKALKKGGNLVIIEPLRGEFTKKSAEYVALLRTVIPFYISQEEKLKKLNDKTWQECVQDIYDEYTFAGEHEQSPNDNLTNKAEMMIEATEKYFKIEKIEYSGAFLEKMIGGLRGEHKYELAKILKFLDDKLVKEKVLSFTNIQVHAVKE